MYPAQAGVEAVSSVESLPQSYPRAETTLWHCLYFKNKVLTAFPEVRDLKQRKIDHHPFLPY
jgi:hypothetical protein